MGKLFLTTWARLFALTSASYVLWASLWAIYQRKFFWDFVGGELGPQGLIPSPKVYFFIKMIVELPIMQTINVVLSIIALTLEYPMPLIKQSLIYRSLPLRIVLYCINFCFAMLLYQTIEGGIFYLITSLVYFVAWKKGEKLGEKAVLIETGTASNVKERKKMVRVERI